MKRIVVPTQSQLDWRRLLAQPERHWKAGRSAMTTATCWDAAADRLPPEIQAQLDGAAPALHGLRLLVAIPEWEVALPGGSRPSFTDVMALATNAHGLCVLAVEAKAGEDFGPTLSDRAASSTHEADARLSYLQSLLGARFHGTIRYQLLHRTASALLTARDFHARTAVMLVQSWRSTPERRQDFHAFAHAMSAEPCTEGVWHVPRSDAPQLFLAWCEGDPEFLK